MSIKSWNAGQIFDDAGRRKYLNADELARFLDLADGYALYRRSFYYVLAYTGCRVSEALALSVDQLDPERRTLTIKTLKRRRISFRVVPVPDMMVEMLQALPLTEGGRFWPMHRATAWRYVKALHKRAGVTGPMACPKGLRHAFGVRAAERNVPLPLIQRWMGHASPTTTAIYVDAIGAEERQFASRMWDEANG